MNITECKECFWLLRTSYLWCVTFLRYHYQLSWLWAPVWEVCFPQCLLQQNQIACCIFSCSVFCCFEWCCCEKMDYFPTTSVELAMLFPVPVCIFHCCFLLFGKKKSPYDFYSVYFELWSTLSWQFKIQWISTLPKNVLYVWEGSRN